MNAYMYHMLLRAREVSKLTEENLLDHVHEERPKCPFCIADEDQQWWYQVKSGKMKGTKPKKPIAPHCEYCPLQNLAKCSMQELMDDCEKIGSFLLYLYEEGCHDV